MNIQNVLGTSRALKRKIKPKCMELTDMGFFKMEPIKENIPPGLSRSVKSPKSSQNLINRQLMTPPKNKKVEDPISPSTNFKMLTSIAASLSYMDTEVEKIKEPLENEISVKLTESPMSQICNKPLEYEPKHQVQKYRETKRQAKSLSLVCEKFLTYYPAYPDTEITVILEDVASRLGIERRRMYDIVNVLEGLKFLVKKEKGKYTWFGRHKLIQTLNYIRAAGISLGMVEKLQNAMKDAPLFPLPPHPEPNAEVSPAELDVFRREKTLGVLSQKFLMLFLVSHSKVIRLDVAGDILDDANKADIKPKVRRLYDVANVLSSLGLIQRVHVLGSRGKKPAFKYIGPHLSSKLDSETIPWKEKRLAPKQPSFQDILHAAEIERERLHKKPNFTNPNVIVISQSAGKTSTLVFPVVKIQPAAKILKIDQSPAKSYYLLCKNENISPFMTPSTSNDSFSQNSDK